MNLSMLTMAWLIRKVIRIFVATGAASQGAKPSAVSPGQPNSVSYPRCTHAGCQPAPPVFVDVPAGYWARPEIEAIYKVGVTAGCVASPRQYCPENNVTRAEMAAFLLRAIEGPSYTPPACTSPTFSDVACSFWAVPWIEELYRRGFTTGCALNPLRYCPSLNLSHAEIVVFLLRIREGVGYTPPACTAAPFPDVLCTHWAAPWIAEAKKRGIAVGDTNGNFNPGVSVLRSQMAGYLVRGFDFPKAIDPATPRTVDLAYTNGLLTEVIDYGTVSYHPNLLVNQVAHGNGVTETWSNDPNAMRRPGSIAATGPAASWSSGTYVYDGTGNITKIGPAWFTYDKVNRLTAGNVYTDPLGGGAGTQQGYTFDPFGNLTAITGANARNTPTTAATNRLTTGTYDAAGNLTGWNGATYQYDRFNQMIRMTSGAQDWAYVYTADDERIWSYDLAEQEPSRWTLRDLSGQVLREYLNDDGAWSVGTDYIHRDGQLLAAETRLGRRHFHLDHLGTPRLITNSVGYKKAYHAYYPFGEEATAFNQDSERMKFTGHERDLASAAGTGDDLDYMHARHYSPLTFHFVSADIAPGKPPLPQSWNRYSYVLGNPLRNVDPNGLEPLDAMLLQFFNLFFHANFSAVDVQAGPLGNAVAAGLNQLGVTVGDSIYLSRGTADKYLRKTPFGIGAIGHELVHVLQFRHLGFGQFLAGYTQNYDYNRRAGQSHEESYKNIILEDIAFRVEGVVLEFLKNNPDIQAKLQAGQELSRDDLAKISSALEDASKQGKFKFGFQFVQGFLVYIPPPSK